MNNLKYAIRNIFKNTSSSLISIIGITLAVACCLLIFVFVNQENGYNEFHSNLDKIYRINYELQYADGRQFKTVRLEPELAEIVKDNVPQVEKSTEYRFGFQQDLKFGDKSINLDAACAGEEFFEIFSFGFIAGSKEDIFESKEAVVITRNIADQLLSDGLTYDQLIGEPVSFPNSYGNTPFIISGILDNIPKNSSINFDAIIPGKNERNFGGCSNWFGYTSIFYQLKDNTDVDLASQNVENEVSKYYEKRVEGLKGSILADVSNPFIPFVLPFKQCYFENDISNCNESTGNKRASNILLAVGLIILIIACSNYSMLSIARNTSKINEYGIRKSIGAKKANIFSLYFTEGLILNLCAFIFGIVLGYFLIPVFNNLANSNIEYELINYHKIVFIAVTVFVIIVFITSLVPVVFGSKIAPSQLLKQKNISYNKGKLSHAFVALQYSLSIILIISAVFIVKQSNYLKNKSLGFSDNYVLNISLNRLNDEKKTLFLDMIKDHPALENLTITSRSFVNGAWNDYVDAQSGDPFLVDFIKVDHNYIPTLEIELIYGKNFDLTNVRDGDRTMIVNEQFIKDYGFTGNPVGEVCNIFGNYFTIIGVTKNFHFDDTKERIRPVMLFTCPNFGGSYQTILAKYIPEGLNNFVDHIKAEHKKITGGSIPIYRFWDEELINRYGEEERWSKIIGYAALIAIIISSLGLFGLTVLLINKRIKEIGVRKVNGASVIEVLATINKTFMVWLTVSIAIATPVAYLIVGKWLNGFPYRTAISWWVFALAGGIALFIGLVTVSFQSWKAASRNPVEALRYE